MYKLFTMISLAIVIMENAQSNLLASIWRIEWPCCKSETKPHNWVLVLNPCQLREADTQLVKLDSCVTALQSPALKNLDPKSRQMYTKIGLAESDTPRSQRNNEIPTHPSIQLCYLPNEATLDKMQKLISGDANARVTGDFAWATAALR